MDNFLLFVNNMSLREKIDMCEGADFWHTRAFPKYGIPSFMMCDGPHGLRKQPEDADNLGINESLPATCFPTSAATACSWDKKLLSEVGRAIGEEAVANHVALVLGPGLNIKRNPLCGRNFEYFSEDPFLSGKLAAAYVKGQQSTGVGSCVKHYMANSQEYKRFASDSIVDERTLREIYLTGFEIAVREGRPAALMTSYNKVNGVHVADSWWYIQSNLRLDWLWEGMVITDWGAMNDRAKAFRAGCDLMMPGGSGYQRRDVMNAVKRSKITSAAVSVCTRRVVQFALDAQRIKFKPCDMRKNHELARRAAEESAVLLKNNGALPLRGSACLIGHMAKKLRYQGVGSSHINPYKLVNPTDCMDYPYAPGCDAWGNTDDALIAEAVELAKTVVTPVVFAGLPDSYESEGFDRKHMRLPEGHNRMIEAVAEANPNTVVVLLCGSPVELPWIDKVNAVLYMALPGQAGGEAIKNLLTGAVNPSGRLAETWPISYDDVVSRDYYGEKDAEYREGIFVGYRYYDSANVPVCFGFGHGLSYTTFEYSDLTLNSDNTVSVTVTNAGDIAGAEVVQLYIEPPKGGIARPVRELKGFDKVFLQPGESKTVTMPIGTRSFAVWHNRGWLVPKGSYTLCVGGLRLTHDPDLPSFDVPVPDWQAGSWYETLEGTPSRAELEKRLGRKIETREVKKGEFDMDSSVEEMAPHSRLMRALYKAIELVIARPYGGKADYDNPEFAMMMTCAAGCSIRNLCLSGGVPEGIVKLLVRIANK